MKPMALSACLFSLCLFLWLGMMLKPPQKYVYIGMVSATGLYVVWRIDRMRL